MAVWSGLHQVLERLFLELEGKQKVDLMASFSKPLLKSARIFFSLLSFVDQFKTNIWFGFDFKMRIPLNVV